MKCVVIAGPKRKAGPTLPLQREGVGPGHLGLGGSGCANSWAHLRF